MQSAHQKKAGSRRLLIENVDFYESSNPEIDNLCRLASNAFRDNQFAFSVKLYQKAQSLAEKTSFDEAFIVRRLGAVRAKHLRTAESHDEMLELSKEAFTLFQNALAIHKKRLSETAYTPVETTEYERTLAYLCKASLDLKNGEALEEAALALYTSSSITKNIDYQFAACNYLYTIFFAQSKMNIAKKYTDEAMRLYDEHKLEDAACFRHASKIELLNGNLEKAIALFWRAYDAHKNMCQGKNRDRVLLDDLKLLFLIRLSAPKTRAWAQKYILIEARKSKLSFTAVGRLKKVLELTLTESKGDGVVLSHQLFQDQKPLVYQYEKSNTGINSALANTHQEETTAASSSVNLQKVGLFSLPVLGSDDSAAHAVARTQQEDGESRKLTL